MKEIVLANCTALAYHDFKGVKNGTSLYTLIKPNTVINGMSDSSIFMNYSENDKLVWGKSELVNLTFSEQITNTMNGFSATVFETSSSIIVSFRGTNDIMDILADIQLMMVRVSSQLGSAYSVIKDIVTIGNPFKKKVYLTGHSLGGALVQAVMATDIVDKIEMAVTFNGLGMKKVLNEWNNGRVSQTALASSFGWSRVINPRIVAESLLGVYKDVRGRKSDSLLGKRVTRTDITGALLRGTSKYTKSNGFTSILQKDIGGIRIELGTTPSDRDIRQTPVAEKHIGSIDNSNLDDETISIIESIMNFLVSVNVTDKTIAKIKNYIISHDAVGCVEEHLGVRIVVDNGDVISCDNTSMGINKLLKTKSLTKVHSMGNFMLFMNNSGDFDGKMRYSFVYNIIRDFIRSDSRYVKVLGNTNNIQISKTLSDLISGAPKAMLKSNESMSKLIFGWALRKVLPYIILTQCEDIKNREFFRIGVKTNLIHDDVDGTIEPRVIMIKD